MLHTKWTPIKSSDDFASIGSDVEWIVLVHLPNYGALLGPKGRDRLTLVMRQYPLHFVEFDVENQVLEILVEEYRAEGVVLDETIEISRDFFALFRGRDLRLDEPRFVESQVVYVDDFKEEDTEADEIPWDTVPVEARAAIRAARAMFKEYEDACESGRLKNIAKKWLRRILKLIG